MGIRSVAARPLTLTGLATALAVAFVVAPAPMAAARPRGGFADEVGLAGALRASFDEYWRAGSSPRMQSLVDYWMRYHLVKAVTAALLLAVLVPLAVRLWTAFARGRGAGFAAGGVAATALAVFSLLLVMANVQGAVTPFSSLLPLLTGGPDSATLEQVRQGLASGSASPVLAAMVDDFARYHVVMAVLAGPAAVGLAAVSVTLWRRFATTPRVNRRARRVLAALGAVTVVLPLLVAMVAVANTTTAADPAPALLAFFQGGW